MAKQSKSKKNQSSEDPQGEENFPAKRQLIVIGKRDLGLRAKKEAVSSVTGANVKPLNDLLASEEVTLEPLFGVSEERLQAQAATLALETGAEVPDLSVYYHVEAPDELLDDLANRLQQMEGIEAAYVKPPAEPAQMKLNDIAPRTDEPPTHTPDFTARQEYLNAAPIGIDARYAWTVPGGRGAGFNIIDIEWGWNFNHEDLLHNQGGVVSGTNSTDDNHGTAVLGEYSGDRNSFGVAGISPDSNAMAVSLVGNNTSQAIRIAADRLKRGDIILLEVHRGGPQFNPGDRTRFGFIAIEWWPDDFDAIRYAISKGVIVVEAAGNGGQNFDDGVYDTRPINHPRMGTFPASWKNPFNPANPSSGAVVVGAGMPPAGTHGRNRQPGWGDVYADRGRCYFSNYGARIDAQGWGWEVTTTGYGDLQGGSDRNEWYTDQFSGTSSASPIIVGALACVQGVLRAQRRIPLSPARAIQLLRSTGSPQQDGPAFTFIPDMAGTGYPQNHPARPRTQRIGNRPNLRQLISRALETRTWVGVQFSRSIPAGTTRRYFTHSWPAHWHVVWTVVPTSPQRGAPQIEWNVQVERASDQHITYFISITNLTQIPVNIEGRYAVLGW
ncbi:S8 family peptidase [Lunatibacter salilacus]|uniref:S8 family peptidase n=1 Tax=Lunatibacter salilacus TaxID=2483804 RepID=UPI00131EB2D0|nr:S8 family peptidase [Lunatibacter salilacus]